MSSWSRGVFSSMVSEVGYDTDKEELLIIWTNGKRSVYSGVPEDVADRLSKAPSVGQMVNMEIKPHYAHRYV